MSDSIKALRDSEAKALAVAQTRYYRVNAVLDALPEGTPLPVAVNPFGYCATASVEFAGPVSVSRLLELYPPLKCVHVGGRKATVKPVKYLRGEDEMSPIAPVYPVTERRTGEGEAQRLEACWWTTLGGHDVQLTAPMKSRAALPLDEAKHLFEAYPSSFGSVGFFRKRLASPVVRICAIAGWHEAWQEFLRAEGYRGAQSAILHTWKNLVLEGQGPWVEERLPETRLTPASAPVNKRVVGPSHGAEAELQAKGSSFKAHLFDQVGDFWHAFTPDTARKLLAFVNRQHAAWPQVQAKHATEQARVNRWLDSFFRRGEGRFADGDFETRRRFAYALRQGTGLDVNVQWVGSKDGATTLRVHFQGAAENCFDRVYRYLPDVLPVRPQDIEVEYA